MEGGRGQRRRETVMKEHRWEGRGEIWLLLNIC